MTSIISMSDVLHSFAQMKFNLQYINTVASASSFNPSALVVGPTVALWTADLTFRQMDGMNSTDLDELDGFITNLQGGKVLARIYNPARKTPKGTGGVSTVNIASDTAAGATSIPLKNLALSQTVALALGDLLGIGENLHKVTAAVGSDGSGDATVNIQPPLRLGVSANDPVNLSKPTALFRLSAGATDLTIGVPILSQALTLSFIEEPDVS